MRNLVNVHQLDHICEHDNKIVRNDMSAKQRLRSACAASLIRAFAVRMKQHCSPAEKQFDLEMTYKVFFFLFFVVFFLWTLVANTLSLKNHSDDTLSSLSVLKYLKWRTRWLPFGTLKTV